VRRLPRRVQGRRGAPLILAAAAAAASAEDPAWGEVLAGLAGCRACHDTQGEPAYSGGAPLETPFGTFVGPNVTADPDHGIGAWSLADFERALRRGRSPDGRAYWPVFPYRSFAHLTDADVAALWAALRAAPPSPRPSVAQDPDHSRLALWAWRRVVGRTAYARVRDPELARGAYLVEAVAHCDGCHSPRTSIGGERRREHLAGTDQHAHGGPNVTPSDDGLAGWTEEDWVGFFDLGQTPDGEFVGGAMRHVIRDGTSLLDDADRRAMARYLMALPPRPDPEDG
jgi:mono/diheme cytochrome c family protein